MNALLERLREPLIAIANAAARDILAVYAAPFTVEHKPDDSPVTAADLAAHVRIALALERLTPDIPVLSEESADSISTRTRRRWQRYWLVDPLDGTREFVKRNGEFTVNIALIENGAAVYGVIQAPVLDTVWHGGPGQGAWRRDARGEQRIRTCAPAPQPLRVAVSRSYRSARMAAILQQIAAIPVGLGSSLKFCRLAEGELDLYPRFGATSEWDTAAGQAIVEGAGGAVLDFNGAPLGYNQRETLINPEFVALGDVQLHWQEWPGRSLLPLGEGGRRPDEGWRRQQK